MKKLYTTHKYKLRNLRRRKKLEKRRRRRNSYNSVLRLTTPEDDFGDRQVKTRYTKEIKEPVVAPENLCLLEATEDCLNFFAKVRSRKSISREGNYYYVSITLKKVKRIDYSTVCILTAIIEDLKFKRIYFRSDFPEDEACKEDIFKSGLLNLLRDETGRPFEKSKESELLFIEKGTKKFSDHDNRRISEIVKRAVEHLIHEKKHFKKLRKVLLEICGNSIEWAKATNNQWLLGVKFEKTQVIFTITDVGQGIMTTLHRKYSQKAVDFVNKESKDILRAAFERKYGSSSRKVNRNKGLPAIKNGFDQGILVDLKVLTNDVILHYDNEKLSRTIRNGKQFEGTLYRWKITKEVLIKELT